MVHIIYTANGHTIIIIGDLIVVGLEIYLIVDQQHSQVRSLQTSHSLQFHTSQRE